VKEEVNAVTEQQCCCQVTNEERTDFKSSSCSNQQEKLLHKSTILTICTLDNYSLEDWSWANTQHIMFIKYISDNGQCPLSKHGVANVGTKQCFQSSYQQKVHIPFEIGPGCILRESISLSSSAILLSECSTSFIRFHKYSCKALWMLHTKVASEISS
jgi:hypothetical protein